MRYCIPRGPLLAATLALLATTALAQDKPADQPAAPAAAPAASGPAKLPPGSPLFDRPADSDAAAKLAPVPAPPIATAVDKLPLDKLKVPKGFKLEVYASGIADARSLAQNDDGSVIFVGNRVRDKVYAIVNKDGKREVKVVAEGLYRPNGVAFKNGTLYIAELYQIDKIDNVLANLDKGPQKPTVIIPGLPKDEAHGWKYLAIGPDNKLYFEVGQPGNNVLHDKDHGLMHRANLDGSGLETIATGIRNTVGFDWNPRNKELYFTDNGRDWMSEDLPNDELNRLTKVGQDFGEPYCHQGNIPDPTFGWGHDCKDYTPPIALMGPHAAALGLKFYTGSMFPDKYRDNIIISRHGSWNKTHKFGGDVVVVQIKKDGNAGDIEPIVTGFLQPNNNYVGRPVDVLVMKDGSIAHLRRLERRSMAR